MTFQLCKTQPCSQDLFYPFPRSKRRDAKDPVNEVSERGSNLEGFVLLATATVIANCQQASLSCGSTRTPTSRPPEWTNEMEGGGIRSTRSWTGDLIQIKHSVSSILRLVVATCDTMSVDIAKLLSFRNHDYYWSVKKTSTINICLQWRSFMCIQPYCDWLKPFCSPGFVAKSA